MMCHSYAMLPRMHKRYRFFASILITIHHVTETVPPQVTDSFDRKP